MDQEKIQEFCRNCNHRYYVDGNAWKCQLTYQFGNFTNYCNNYENNQEKQKDIIIDAVPIQIPDGLTDVLKTEQKLLPAILTGCIASILGAGFWASITVFTGYSIGYMAIVLGVIVGISIRYFGKGIDKIFGILSVVFAIISVILGNILSSIGYISYHEGVSFFSIISQLNLSIIWELYLDTFSPVDILFYIIAAVSAYKLSFRIVTHKQVNDFKKRGIIPDSIN
jgi:hypothetical protein